MKRTAIVYAKRSPIGRYMGGLSTLSAPHLGARLIKDAMLETGITPSAVDGIVMGQVLTAGSGQAPARQTALYGGLPHSVPATTVNKVCGSGMKAVMLADQEIRLGEGHVYFAGGQESMSLAPHLVMNGRAGLRFGDVVMKDHMQLDGLWDPYNQVAMGVCGDTCAREYPFSREEQDSYALASYERARTATEKGYFKKELLPYTIENKKSSVVVDRDEEPFAVDLARLRTLPPAFGKDGTVTAGNASSINDGAAMLMLCSEDATSRLGLQPLAYITAHCSFAQEPMWFSTAPIGCVRKLLQQTKLSAKDIDLFEINEAFSVVTMAAIRDLELDPEKVNIHGGAVALGHPIGASGARVLVTLVHALAAQKLRRGIATLCIGGGEAVAMLVERA